jgi:hypothetical protein
LSSIVALEAFDRPEILIAGGYDKHLPFDDLGRKIAQKAKVAILIGQTAPQIAQAIEAGSNGRSQARVEFARSLAEAVQTAHELASPATSCCSVPPAPATTCSRTTSSAATSSPSWREGLPPSYRNLPAGRRSCRKKSLPPSCVFPLEMPGSSPAVESSAFFSAPPRQVDALVGRWLL